MGSALVEFSEPLVDVPFPAGTFTLYDGGHRWEMDVDGALHPGRPTAVFLQTSDVGADPTPSGVSYPALPPLVVGLATGLPTAPFAGYPMAPWPPPWF
jgi:hypothetical protein